MELEVLWANFKNQIKEARKNLKENINAANITPIPLKMKKETRAFPKQSTPEENWCITDNDYTNIKKKFNRKMQ